MSTRLNTPRVPPLEKENWDEQVQKIFRPMVGAGTVYNIFKTMAHHPDLFPPLAGVCQSRAVQIDRPRP